MTDFRSKTWLADWFRKNMPTREQMEHNRFIRPFAGRVLRSELWRFTRRSVPRGVALGLLVGIIIPFAQILFAALLSVPLRANVPIAALTTFVTNPVTTPLLWIGAYWVGGWLLRVDAATVVAPVSRAIEQTELQQFLEWLTGATMVTVPFAVSCTGIATWRPMTVSGRSASRGASSSSSRSTLS